MIESIKHQEIKIILREHFPQLNHPSLRDEISASAELIEIPEGAVIQDYGSFPSSVPLVFKGSIKVMREDSDGNELFLYYLRPGESCAASFSCCMMRKKSEIRAVAEEPTSFLAIPLHKADTWLGQFPVWRNFVFQMYEDRMYDLIDTVDRLAFTKMDEQLMDYLEKRVRVTGNHIIKTTHQEIATDLNASREAISRLLKKLEQDGMVELGRNKVTLTE